MSKEAALGFLEQAATQEPLKTQVNQANDGEQVLEMAQAHGYDISHDHMRQAIPDIRQRQGFFGDIVDAVLRLFGPTHDDYPATGAVPFSGEPNR